MLTSYNIVRKRVYTFDRISHADADFRAICWKINCDYVFKPQRKKGYFVTDSSGDYIFIDSRITGFNRFEAMFHELTHALLDVPCPFLHFRQQIQAETFALIFLIPKKMLFEYMNMSFDEIDYRLIPYLKRRKFIFDTYGI